MTRLRLLLLLARWEFMRYFKVRELLISLGISFALIVALAVAGKLVAVAKAGAEPTRLAVVGEAPFALPSSTDDFTWTEDAADSTAALDAALAAGTLDGYVEFESAERGTIVSETDGAWLDALRIALSDARRDARVRSHGLEQESLDDILRPFDLERRTAADAGDDDDAATASGEAPSKAAKVIAIALVVLMFIGIMAGTSYLFVGITSEKQARVTEQIVAATPPQTWIDGKILGSAARSSLSLGLLGLQCTLGIAVWLLVARSGPGDIFGAIEIGQVLAFALLAVLGFALWFCFFAAIAATINDPNTSSRGMFLFLPMLSALFAVPVYLDPTGWLSVVLGVLPITSPVALPMRMILADAAWWELPVAVIGLLGAIWLTRRGAGKVFALGIMMHGKEPSWRDMVRAFRAG